ncbi:transcriptional regulator [Methanocella sp. CWC-04]|uniref:Transcriptional regulator n=2 Tax=Methanooceanicella nereidis TaxID=2052831 RepID=A0AAP2W6G9_9EURY|nr:transcriptional regulator [Methanocella sp. CWC-04]
MSQEKVEIYSTKKGIIAVDSPVKNRILQKLQERELSFEELIRVCGKAKSTMSVHLNDLLKMGLIYKRVDPVDRRKKYFGINSDLIVSSSPPVTLHYIKILNTVPSFKGDKYGFLRSLFHLIRCGMESYGIDTRPALKKIGHDVGSMLAPSFKSSKLPDLLNEVAAFWKEQGLGKVHAEMGVFPTIIVEDCFDCGTLPDVGRTECSLDEGILEAIIEERLKVKCSVDEIECHGTGHDHCKFEVKIF